MKRLILFLLLPVFVSAQSGWNMNLLGSFDYDTNHNTKCNDIWGWEDGNGNEYALVGLENGFSCVDVTTPSNPVEMFFISDINSTWRDIKTWGQYAYITTEANAGLLIVDLSDLTGNTYWHVSQFTNPVTGTSVTFTAAHNLYIDENGICYIFGASSNSGGNPSNGAIFLDVSANAIDPVYLGEWDEEYIHDGMARGDTMYAGCISTGDLYIVDVSNKANPIVLGTHQTPNAFTHNAWVSDNGNFVFTTDEKPDSYIASYNISDISNIQEVDRIQSNPGSNSIPHNTHVDENFLITSYYTEGTTVHDITYPNHMVEVAYYDSYTGSGPTYDGCWGTYPFLSSGNIISSDRNSYNGKGILNIYGRAFQQACYLMGNVTDAINGNNLASTDISILNTTTTANANIIGAYQTAVVDSGTYQVVFSRNGYISDTLSILLDNGIMTTLNAQLYPITCPVELFISEYGEGSGYNKYLEIYNGTGISVDLSLYEIWKVTNGGIWPGYTLSLSGILAHNDVYIIYSSNSNIDSTIIAAGDTMWSGANWNGDDAVGLAKNGILIDAVGTDGPDPGSGWDVAGVFEATKDHTLVRDSSVISGNPNWIISAGTNSTNSEWIVLSQNDWNDIGQHNIINCQFIFGCTDPLACNYDASATINDSSCVYPIIWQQSFSICNGDSIIVGNSIYNTIGNYIDTLAALNGCDSIVYTNISITPPSVWQWGTAICDGDSVVVGTSVYNTIGNYTDTLTALNGCDSIVYTNISMLPPVTWQQAFSICDGDSILVGSNVYNTAGNYTDTLNTVNGCDSIVYTNISMDYNTSSYDTLSVTSSIVWNGSTLSVSGDYSATLINLVGCDSIAYLNLTITNTTGVIELINNKQLVKITDMLGQETPYRRNTPLFYIYADGTVEKRIVIE
jgi:choice-of-anchor B domain-containing protein